MNLRKAPLALAVFTLTAAPFAGIGVQSAQAHDGAHGGTMQKSTFGHASMATTTLWAKATELNDSGASSTTTAWLTGNQLKIKITSTGLLAGAPHAQHIHIGGTNTCPDADAKGTGVDGHLRVVDGMKSYGMIAVSLTTSGDSTPASGLAVDRFPVGSATYERTLKVDDATAKSLAEGKGVIVQHGVDYNNDGTYSGDSKSELDAKLPEEATDPATCGVLEVSQMSDMPHGGVQTGEGSTDPVAAIALGTGIGAVALGGGGLAVSRRRRNRN